ncbi:hypothetical protein, partial [Rhizobium johnstonii]|uniref:hypothetical protein n=1 Tax=Rhizobium johnstonii TaxID=3019933 RepID=UPI003F9CD1AB
TLVAVFAVALAACEQEGPAERAGKALDNAVEQAGDKIENAGDKGGSYGAMGVNVVFLVGMVGARAPPQHLLHPALKVPSV